MEDSGVVQTEENKVSVDGNKKRTVKTPAQVTALESFYQEHKFPSDEMKSQLAVQVGLTEKQISSWFCHRRLKDKRRDEGHANGRQDLSSGIIQDRGSGLRQDSCGSIKQGDNRNFDPREVESQRIYGQEFPLADLTYGRRSRQNQYDAQMEDTSSESSSSLHDQPVPGNRDLYDTQMSAKLAQSGAVPPINPKTAKSMCFKPSGYLKVKGDSEHPAITAVKRQLGRHYKEDGPILGIDFDPLPPGAFELPNSDPVDAEPIYVGDFRQPHSPDISGVIKQPNYKIMNEVHNSKMSSQDSYFEGADFNTMHVSERQDGKSQHQSKYRSSLLCSLPFPSEDSSLDIYKGSADKPAVNDCKQSRMSSKLAVERMGSDSLSNHPGRYGGKVASEQEKLLLHDNDIHTYKAPKNENLSKTSNLISGCSQQLGAERGPPARMGKVEKLGREWKQEYPVGVKTDPTNEMRATKRVNVEFLEQDFVANASHSGLHQLTKPTKGSCMEVPCSFSEDETAETSSSLD